MYWKVNSLVFIALLHITFADENQTFLSDESRLIYDLLTKSKYDKNVRPISDPSKAVVVEFKLSLINVIELDVIDEVLILNVWETFKWKDEFMKWNPEEYGGVKKIQVSSDRLWIPDIKLANQVLEENGMIQNMVEAKCVVSNDGTILNIPTLQLRSFCNLNVRYFPFDSQICSLKFMPWSNTGSQLDLSLFDTGTKGADIDNYSPSPIYRIFKLSAEKHEYFYSNSQNEREKYVDVVIHVGLARRPLHYIFALNMPCAIISILVLLVFRIASDSSQKITLGITVLLVFNVMLTGFSAKLPTTNHLSLFTLYITTIMIMTGLSVILSVTVLNLHGKSQDKEIPGWVQKVFLEKMATLLRNRRVRPKENATEHNDIELSDIDVKTGNDKTSNDERLEKLLRLMLEKEESEKMKSEVKNEWHDVAMIVDRLFFWCFSIITVIISVYMLVVIPIANRTPTDENLKGFEGKL